MSNIFITFQDLLDYVETSDVSDEILYDGGGQPYKKKSKHFKRLIDKTREELEKLAQLPYPVTSTLNREEEPPPF